MGRRHTTYHLERSRTDGQTYKDSYGTEVTRFEATAYCGEKTVFYGHDSKPWRWLSGANALKNSLSPDCCTKCAKKFWMNRENGYPSGYSVDTTNLAGLRDIDTFARFEYKKAAYRIIRDSDTEIVGYITLNNGWGQRWEIQLIGVSGAGGLTTYTPSYFDGTTAESDIRFIPGLLSAKEAAPFVLTKFIESKKYPIQTLSEALAESEKRKAAFAEARRVQEQADLEHEKLKAKHKATLVAMYEKASAEEKEALAFFVSFLSPF